MTDYWDDDVSNDASPWPDSPLRRRVNGLDETTPPFRFIDERRARRLDARELLDHLSANDIVLRIEAGVLRWRCLCYGMDLQTLRNVRRLERELKSELRCRAGEGTVFDICESEEARFDQNPEGGMA